MLCERFPTGIAFFDRYRFRPARQDGIQTIDRVAAVHIAHPVGNNGVPGRLGRRKYVVDERRVLLLTRALQGYRSRFAGTRCLGSRRKFLATVDSGQHAVRSLRQQRVDLNGP